MFDIGQKGHFFMKKGHYFEKRAPRFHTHARTHAHSIPFLNILHQNKAFHNFCKKGQRSIVECNIGLEYIEYALNKSIHVMR